jgi:hypothetical protein
MAQERLLELPGAESEDVPAEQRRDHAQAETVEQQEREEAGQDEADDDEEIPGCDGAHGALQRADEERLHRVRDRERRRAGLSLRGDREGVVAEREGVRALLLHRPVVADRPGRVVRPAEDAPVQIASDRQEPENGRYAEEGECSAIASRGSSCRGLRRVACPDDGPLQQGASERTLEEELVGQEDRERHDDADGQELSR